MITFASSMGTLAKRYLKKIYTLCWETNRGLYYYSLVSQMSLMYTQFWTLGDTLIAYTQHVEPYM